MPLTQPEFSQRTLMLLAAGDPNSIWLSMETEAGLAQTRALRDLGEAVAKDPLRFGLLQQAYSVTLTAGIGSLAAATGALTALADIIWPTVPQGFVKDANNVKLSYIRNPADFEGVVTSGLFYYNLKQSRIYVRGSSSGDYTSDLSEPVSPLTVIANYYPSIGTTSTLPTELEDDAVAALAEVLVRKFGKDGAKS